PIKIDECALDGQFIRLANTSKDKDIDVSNWLLVRKVEDHEDINYYIPSNVRIYRGQTIKILTRLSQANRAAHDLVNMEIDSWGLGMNITTRLFNDDEEERASHIQRTGYPSSR
ncbi:unnamed protein product, partial [Didymodactylos carnosus]